LGGGSYLGQPLQYSPIIGCGGSAPAVDLDHYERESDPIEGQDQGVLVLSELLAHLDTTQVRLADALEKEDEQSLQRLAPYRDRPERPISFWLFFLYFHDCYHVGQTEILRQAAGKDDKII
jgi:hypothetical protein